MKMRKQWNWNIGTWQFIFIFRKKISWQQPFSGLNELFNSPPGLNNNTFKSHSSNCGKICLVGNPWNESKILKIVFP